QNQRSYAIQAGTLSSVLSRFARESQILLAVDTRLTAGKHSDGLQGRFAVNEGLAQLLRASGLRAVPDSQGNYTLEAVDPVAVSVLPAVEVQGCALGNALGSVAGYNATHSSVATKTSKELVRTAQSVSVVTIEQIEKQGSVTVAEAVRYTAGVLSNPYG